MKCRTAVLVVLIAAALNHGAAAKNKAGIGHWVSAWSTAVHSPLPFPGLPPSPVFENQTIRMVVRPSIGGERVRIRLSNAYGTNALAIGAAHIGITRQEAMIAPESDRALTFGGKASVSIPAGAPIMSDPVDLKVAPFAEITVSVYLPENTPASTVHFWAQHETYISGPGDFTAKAEIPNPTTKLSWYWLADVEVWAPDQATATVTLGDSILTASVRSRVTTQTGRTC